MGLTFDLANPLAVVSEVVDGGSSHAAGVKVGDHLVRRPLDPLRSSPLPYACQTLHMREIVLPD